MSPVSTIDPPQTITVSLPEPIPAAVTPSVRTLTPPDVDPNLLVEEIPPFPVRPFTLDQYEYLVDVGFFGEARVEMLDGFVVNKMTHGSLATVLVNFLADLLKAGVGSEWCVRVQSPIRLSHSEPEPDVAVAKGGQLDFLKRHPVPEELPLIIEISDSTLAKDRGPKLRAYARAGILEYWIVNCLDRQIEIHAQPQPSTEPPRYATTTILHRGETATVRIEGQPPIEIPLSRLFGE